MSDRRDRLPALRRLSVDPGATPAERELAAAMAAKLSKRKPSKPRIPGVTLDASSDIPLFRWVCPVCGERVSHPAGLNPFATAQAIHAARQCFLCADGQPILDLKGAPLPGAIPDVLWSSMVIGEKSAGVILVALEAIRVSAPIRGSDRDGLRFGVQLGLEAGECWRTIPKFSIREKNGRLVVRWRA